MHQNAVFGAFVGGFMHEFPDSGSAPGFQVQQNWFFVVFRPVSGSAPGRQVPKIWIFIVLRPDPGSAPGHKLRKVWHFVVLHPISGSAQTISRRPSTLLTIGRALELVSLLCAARPTASHTPIRSCTQTP